MSQWRGTAIDLSDCIRVNMKRDNKGFFPGAVVLLAVVAFAAAGAVAQQPDPGERGTAKSEPSTDAPPQPTRPDGNQEPHHDTNPEPAPPTSTAASICLLVESAAQAHGLPFEFFARLIWQESRFRSDAVGPITRS